MTQSPNNICFPSDFCATQWPILREYSLWPGLTWRCSYPSCGRVILLSDRLLLAYISRSPVNQIIVVVNYWTSWNNLCLDTIAFLINIKTDLSCCPKTKVQSDKIVHCNCKFYYTNKLDIRGNNKEELFPSANYNGIN